MCFNAWVPDSFVLYYHQFAGDVVKILAVMIFLISDKMYRTNISLCRTEHNRDSVCLRDIIQVKAAR